MASAYLINEVKRGLGNTKDILGDPMSGGYKAPGWYGYSDLQRFELISNAVTLLEEGEEFADAEIKSLEDLYEGAVCRRQADAHKLQRDRYAYVVYDTRRGIELGELGARLRKLLTSARKTAGPVATTESAALR